MTTLASDNQVQKMLSIIYQIPIGLIEAEADGKITAMNAKSIQLLLPLFNANGLTGHNINSLLQVIAPDILAAVQSYTLPYGNILRQRRQEVSVSNDQQWCFLFTVDKLDEQHFTYVFDDVTELYQKEQELNRMIQDNAIEQLNKFEIASGLLHDIGNAVVGFGSYITKINRSIEQKNDISTLQNLKAFIEKNQHALETALGQPKSRAIADLLGGLIANQQQNLDEVKNSISDQLKIVSHIQEILNIQRQYVKGHYVERASISIRDLINDSFSMLGNSFDKRGIQVKLKVAVDIGQLKGDRTKLMQVLLNLLKNAVDAGATELTLIAGRSKDGVKILLKDNGRGFDASTGARLFNRGFTTKPEGTGLGLSNCKGIIEAHNGQITLTSNGPGNGATATITFNFNRNGKH